jgi:hypothetical protein
MAGFYGSMSAQAAVAEVKRFTTSGDAPSALAESVRLRCRSPLKGFRTMKGTEHRPWPRPS